jgi:hypothetical protein
MMSMLRTSRIGCALFSNKNGLNRSSQSMRILTYGYISFLVCGFLVCVIIALSRFVSTSNAVISVTLLLIAVVIAVAIRVFIEAIRFQEMLKSPGLQISTDSEDSICFREGDSKPKTKPRWKRLHRTDVNLIDVDALPLRNRAAITRAEDILQIAKSFRTLCQSTQNRGRRKRLQRDRATPRWFYFYSLQATVGS